jgi:hypothetical protein
LAPLMKYKNTSPDFSHSRAVFAHFFSAGFA